MTTDLVTDRRALGRTGVRIPTLGLGAANLGNLHRAIDDPTAYGIVEAAWDQGVRYYDTAPHYGLGLSERRLGAALAGRDRDSYVLSTKVGRLLEPNPHPTGSDRAHLFEVPDDLHRVLDYSGDGVRRSLEASLTRLGLDRVDVVYVHDPDDHVDAAIAGAVPALAALRDEGVIGAVGVGMNQWQAPLRFVEESDIDVVMLAGRWTLLDRSGQPLLDRCLERGVAVVVAAPFNSGVLATDNPPDDAHFDYTRVPREQLVRARELAAAAVGDGTHLLHAALQFPLRHPAVAAVVAGASSPAQASSMVMGMKNAVPQRFWDELDGETR